MIEILFNCKLQLSLPVLRLLLSKAYTKGRQDMTWVLLHSHSHRQKLPLSSCLSTRCRYSRLSSPGPNRTQVVLRLGFCAFNNSTALAVLLCLVLARLQCSTVRVLRSEWKFEGLSGDGGEERSGGRSLFPLFRTWVDIGWWAELFPGRESFIDG